MSSSRESYESDQSGEYAEEYSREEDNESLYESESSSESVEDPTITLLRILIFSPHLSSESKIELMLTSYSNYHLVIDWLLQNLKLLCEARYSSLLTLLEYVMGEKTMMEKNEEGQAIAKTVMTNIQTIPMEQNINEQSFQRIINAVRKSGYSSHAHETAVASFATFYGNHKLLHFLLKNNFPFEPTFSKIKDKFIFYMGRKIKAKAECFLRTLEVVTELELKNTLRDVNSKILHFKFVIHNNGGVLIEGRETRVPGHAAKVFEIINTALNAEEKIIAKFDEIAIKITGELSNTNSVNDQNNNWLSLTWVANMLPQIGGARDSSTDHCYEDMLDILREGVQILDEYKQLLQQYEDEWCDRDGIHLVPNPTMSQ